MKPHGELPDEVNFLEYYCYCHCEHGCKFRWKYALMKGIVLRRQRNLRAGQEIQNDDLYFVIYENPTPHSTEPETQKSIKLK
eukprot:4829085-Karenia_brevis.AAC.1